MWKNSVTFFSHWPYILFIERRVSDWMHLSDEHINGVHLSYFRQVVHVYYQVFDSKMADGDQLWSVPKHEYDLLRRNVKIIFSPNLYLDMNPIWFYKGR
jgi:hypothetical protein